MIYLCLTCSFKIVINFDNNSRHFGEKSGVSSNGVAAFDNLQIKTEGNYTIQMKSDKAISSESSTFLIKNYYLHLNLVSKFHVITNKDLHLKSYFSIEAQVLDSDKNRNLYDSYRISLNITPDTEIENYKTVTTFNSKGTFSDLRIFEIGNYQLKAYGQGLISGNINISIIDCYFSWSYKLEKINNITIQFEKNLERLLNIEDFLITSEKAINFTLQQQNFSEYIITAIAEETIPQDTEISIKVIENDIKSEDGFYFDNSILYINLSYIYVQVLFPSSFIVQAIVNSSSTSIKVSISSSIVAALVSNPSFLWSLMNCLDIMSYLPLSSLPYTDSLVSYFTTLGSLNVFPNPADYFFTISNTSEPYLEGKRFGFETSYFLYNSGLLLSYFIISISLIPLFYLGSLVLKNSIRAKCIRYLKKYKYRFFLRFWVQGFLNIGVLSIIQLRSV